jgi:uncharacterized protein (DUF3084 family)
MTAPDDLERRLRLDELPARLVNAAHDAVEARDEAIKALRDQVKVLARALDSIETSCVCRQELTSEPGEKELARRMATIAGTALDKAFGDLKKVTDPDE